MPVLVREERKTGMIEESSPLVLRHIDISMRIREYQPRLRKQMPDQSEVQGSPVFQQAKIKVVKENTFFNQKSMDGNRYAILQASSQDFGTR